MSLSLTNAVLCLQVCLHLPLWCGARGARGAVKERGGLGLNYFSSPSRQVRVPGSGRQRQASLCPRTSLRHKETHPPGHQDLRAIETTFTGESLNGYDFIIIPSCTMRLKLYVCALESSWMSGGLSGECYKEICM